MLVIPACLSGAGRDGPVNPAVIPAKAGIQEGGAGMLDGLRSLPVRWLIPLLSFPLCGNGSFRPLDSSLRWNDDGGRDGFFCHSDSPFAIPAKFLTLAPSVIPAQAGIQEGRAGMLDGLRSLPVRWLIPLLSFPLCGNGLSKLLDSSAACRGQVWNRSPRG